MEVPKPIALCRAAAGSTGLRSDRHHSHEHHFFFFKFFMILTLGELRHFFLPDIAAVEAGGRAVIQSC